MNQNLAPFVLQVRRAITYGPWTSVRSDHDLSAVWKLADSLNVCRVWRIVQSVRKNPESRRKGEKTVWHEIKLSPAMKSERALRPPRRNRFQPGKTQALTSGAGDAS